MSHKAFRAPLGFVADEGVGVVSTLGGALNDYVDGLRLVNPDDLSRDEALGFWINLYNAGALILVARAQSTNTPSVLGIPGGFRSKFVSIGGERLSLDDIEHGKVRRFGDPRIHAALVCGSISCPTLRREPYEGPAIHEQLDDQLRYLLAAGGCTVDRSGKRVLLSRIFRWYGSDFARPHRMPTLLPASRRPVLSALSPWLDPEDVAWIDSTRPEIEFQPYDWALGCAVR
ncbi:MAG: DUF547 domain-containing protein [Acidimicrobiia bacterium]